MFEMDFYAFGLIQRVRGVWSRWWYWWLAAKGVNLSIPLRSKESFGAAGRVLSRSPPIVIISLVSGISFNARFSGLSFMLFAFDILLLLLLLHGGSRSARV